jgi:hypothetical protein
MEGKAYKLFCHCNQWMISVRGYLLTDRERRILEAYVNDGTKLDGFSVLAIRLKRARKDLEEDYGLIERALRRIELDK